MQFKYMLFKCNNLSGLCIHCYISNSSSSSSDSPTRSPLRSELKVIDCSSLGIQREELYCRNVTMASGETHHSCVAMSW